MKRTRKVGEETISVSMETKETLMGSRPEVSGKRKGDLSGQGPYSKLLC